MSVLHNGEATETYSGLTGKILGSIALWSYLHKSKKTHSWTQYSSLIEKHKLVRTIFEKAIVKRVQEVKIQNISVFW